MRWGQNVGLPAVDVKRAALERVQEVADKRGMTVPKDMFDFMRRADVIYLDEHDQPVSFVRAIVTWSEEG